MRSISCCSPWSCGSPCFPLTIFIVVSCIFNFTSYPHLRIPPLYNILGIVLFTQVFATWSKISPHSSTHVFPPWSVYSNVPPAPLHVFMTAISLREFNLFSLVVLCFPISHSMVCHCFLSPCVANLPASSSLNYSPTPSLPCICSTLFSHCAFLSHCLSDFWGYLKMYRKIEKSRRWVLHWEEKGEEGGERNEVS